MKAMKWVLILALIAAGLPGCGSTRKDTGIEATAPVIANYPTKVRVFDVSNNTGELFDVDVIGLLWNSLDESLKNKGMLWTGPREEAPYSLEAHILKYDKGNFWVRAVVPGLGKTVLAVRCDIKQQGRTVATIESKETISMGSGGYSWSAWKKIFQGVAEDVVAEIMKKV